MSKLVPLLAYLVIVLASCLVVVLLSAEPQRVEAKSGDPEPAECTPWATIGAQNVWKCIDIDTDVVCYVNNYAFMQCVLP